MPPRLESGLIGNRGGRGLLALLGLASMAVACGGQSRDDIPAHPPGALERVTLQPAVDRDMLADTLPLPDDFFDYNAVEREDEITAARSAVSYTFRRPDGTLLTVIGTGLENYVDDAGRHRPIERSIRPFSGEAPVEVLTHSPAPPVGRADGNGEASERRTLDPTPPALRPEDDRSAEVPAFRAAFANTRNNPRSYFPEDPSLGVLVAFDSDDDGRVDVGMRWRPTRRVLDLPGGDREVLPFSAGVAGASQADRMRYEGTYPGVVEEYVVQAGRLKHDIILKRAPLTPGQPAPSSSRLYFEGTLELTQGLWPAVDGVVAAGDFVTSSPIDFLDETGRPVFRLARPLAYEQGDPSIETDAEYRVSVDDDGSITVSLATPLSWLLDPARVYPVVIDPSPETISASYSCDATNGGLKDDTRGYNIVGGSASTVWRAAYKFGLDVVPPYALVNGVSLQLHVQLERAQTTRIARLSNDPLTATGAVIYAGVLSGTEYVASSQILQALGSRSQTLPAAVGDVQTAVESGGWIALGLNQNSEGNNTNARVTAHTAATEADRPRLIVSYDMPALEILRFNSQPPETAHVGVPFSVQVTVVDGFGAINPAYSTPISLLLENNPGGATLRMGGGTTVTATPSGGTALFEGLTLDRVGGPYSLRATSVAADHEDVTDEFMVDPEPVSISIVSGDGQLGAAGRILEETLVVEVRDVGGNRLNSVPIVWQASGDAQAMGAPLTDDNGRASASVLLGSTGGDYTITATVSGTSLIVAFLATAIPAPTLLSPIEYAHVESRRPTFRFMPGDAPERLLLQWDTSPLFPSPTEQIVGPGPTGEASVYTLSTAQQLTDGGTYYWRVRDVFPGGLSGPWSDLRSFTVYVSLARYGWHMTTGIQLRAGELAETRIEANEVRLGFSTTPSLKADFEGGGLESFTVSGCGAPLCSVENTADRSFSGTRSLRLRNQDPSGNLRAVRTGAIPGNSARVEYYTLRQDSRALAGSPTFSLYYAEQINPTKANIHYGSRVSQWTSANVPQHFMYNTHAEGTPADSSRTFYFSLCLPSVPWSQNTWYKVAIEYSDRTASIFVDDRPCVTDLPFVDAGFDPTSLELNSWSDDDGVVWYLDDISVYPPSVSGTWHSPPIAFSDRPEGTTAWGPISWTADAPGGSSVIVQAEYSTNGGQSWSLVAGSLAGTTLPLVRLRATLARSTINDPTPVLRDVSVGWEEPAADAAGLAFLTAPQTMEPGVCSNLIEFRTVDALGAETTVAFDTTVYLSSGAPSNTFHSSPDCSPASQVNALTLALGQSRGSFYVRGTIIGDFTLTAAAIGLAPGDLSHTIWPPGDPVALAFTTGPQVLDAGACSAQVRVQLRDQFGNMTWSMGSPTSVTLGASPGPLTYHLLPDCGDVAVTSVLIPEGEGNSEATFYLRGTTPALYTVTASATGLDPDTLAVEIQIGPPSAEASTIAANPTSIEANGVSTSTITVTLKDAAGNQLPKGPVNVLLSEDFEDGAPTWTIGHFSGTGTDFEIGVPTAGPGSAYSGARLAATVLAGNYTGGESPGRGSFLQSPVFDASLAELPALRFWHWYETEEDATAVWDGGNVKLSVDGGSTFTELDPTTVTPAYITLAPNCDYQNPLCHQLGWGGSSGVWIQVVIDLALNLDGRPADQVVIRFEFGADNYPSSWKGWYIDDVRVLDAALPDEFPVVLTTTAGTISEVLDNGDGTYSATLTSTTTLGTATVTGYLYGGLIGTVDVQFTGKEPSAATSTITASPGSIIADGLQSSTITVQLKDEFGANVTDGGHNVALATNLGALSPIIDHGDGTFTASLTSASFGTATISGTLGGIPLVDTAVVLVDPVTLTVTAPSHTITYGAAAPALTPTYSGFIGGDGPGSLVTQPTCTTSYSAGQPAGSYATNCSGGVDSRYGFTYVPGTLTVQPKALTITANDAEKTYGQTHGFDPGAGFFVLGLEPSDSVTAVTLASAGAASTAAVGSYEISVSDALGTGLSNYTITYVPGTLTVNQKSLTVTAADAGKTYGQTHLFDQNADFSAAGLQPGDSVTSVTLVSAGAAAGAAVGTYPISVSDALGTSLSNYAITYVPGTLTVNRKSLTITAADANKIYGEAHIFDQSADFSVAGLEPGDSVTQVTLASAGADSGAMVGTYAVTASGALGAGLTNYDIIYLSGTLTVSLKTLIITANDATKVYGQVHAFDQAADFSVVGLLAGDSVTGVTLSSTGAAAGAAVGSYSIAAGDAVGSGLSNYQIDYVFGTLTVNPKALTITANGATKVYGQTHTFDTSSDFTTVGLEVGDSVTSVFLSSTGALSEAAVGAYDIIASDAAGVGLSNYAITYVFGTLTVQQKPLIVTARDQAKTYGQAFVFDEADDFTVSGLETGDRVDSVALFSDGASVDAPQGSYQILVSGALGVGLSNYAIVYQTGTLTVVEKALTITATDASKIYGQNHLFDQQADFTVFGLAVGDSVTSVSLWSAGAAAAASYGNYDIVPSEAVGVGLENYTIIYQIGTLTVTRKPLTITAADASKTYGQTHLFDTGADFSSSGLETWDSVTGVSLTSAGTASGAAVGGYEIIAANASGIGLSNYTITYVPGTLTVNQKSLTVTAANAGKTYGQTHLFDQNTDFSVAGLQPGDSVTSVTLASAGAAAGAAVGSYEISVSDALGTGLSNYAIAYVPGTLTVNRKSLTITAADANKIYGETHIFDQSADFSVASLEPGDSVTQVSLASAGADSGAAAGTYAVTASGALGAGLTNYDIIYLSGTLTVSLKALVITANDATKVYGQVHAFDQAADFSVVGLLAGDSVTGVTLSSTGSAAIAPAGAHEIIAGQATGLGIENYEITYLPGTLTVQPKLLTVMAPSLTVAYAEPAPVLAPEYDGFVAGDDSTDLATAPVCTTTYIAGDPLGAYPTSCSGGVSGDYTFDYVGGTLTVVPAEATVLVFVTAPRTVAAGSCSGVVVLGSEDAFGHASAVTTPTAIALLADSPMLFFTDPDCTMAATVVTLGSGESEASFYFADTLAGQPTIFADAGPAFTAADQTQTILPAAIDTDTTTITAADETLTADGTSTTTVTVLAVDAFGNALTEGGEVICLFTAAGTLSGDQGPCPAGWVQAVDLGDGSYLATLTASTDASETAVITGRIVGVGIILDGASIDFVPGLPEAGTSTIFASPVSIEVGGTQSSTLTVQARDALGNDVAVGGSLVCLTTTLGILSGAQGSCAPGAVAAIDLGDGSYTAELTSMTTGTATVAGSLNGAAIPNGTEVTVLPGAPYRVAIAGATSAVAGDTATLSLRIADQFGNTVPVALEIMVELFESATASILETRPASVDTPSPAASLTTGADGLAEIDIGDSTAGTVSVCADGPALPGRPVCHSIDFGAGAPDHVLITSAAGTVLAGQPAALTLEVFDANGNKVEAVVSVGLAATGSGGGAPTIDGSASPVLVVTGATGILNVALVDTTAETVGVSVESATGPGGEQLPASRPHGEVQVEVVAGPADHAILLTPEETTAGTETAVSVQLVDAFGNFTSGAVAVCVTAFGEDGGAPSMGPGADPATPETACVVTDSGTGTGSLILSATRAETVRLNAESSGLSGSGDDDVASLIVHPAAPDHLRLTPEDGDAFACRPFAVEVQVVDPYDNPVEVAIEVTLLVDAVPEGDARIVEAELLGADPGALPAAQVTGETDSFGRARIVVILDAREEMVVSWSSMDLLGDPQGKELFITFSTGPTSATLSEVSVQRTQVSVGRTTRIDVLPLDECGLTIGPGAAVELDEPGPAGLLTSVVDEGDGSYTSIFTATDCPMTAEVGVTVDGVRLAATAAISTLCPTADPDLSTVAVVEEALACATDGIGALISVVLLDEDGEDLGPDFPVNIEEDHPFVVAVGERGIEIDPDTGNTVHLLRVGSNRCSAEPRSVHVNAGGVRLAQVAELTFGCPPVDPASAIYLADPARAPANGLDPVVVTLFAKDTCGNPAFGRGASIAVTAPYLDETISPETALLRDAVGADDDGAAAFEIRSRLAGVSGVSAVVDGVNMEESGADLLVFDLQDVLAIAYESNAKMAVIGQMVTLTARLENHYGAALQGITLELQQEGLTTLRAEGATLEADGSLSLDGLESGEVRVIDIRCRVSISAGEAGSTILASYVAEGVTAPNTATSGRLSLAVMGGPFDQGCECASGAGSPASPWLPALLVLLMATRRRLRGSPRPCCRRMRSGVSSAKHLQSLSSSAGSVEGRP